MTNVLVNSVKGLCLLVPMLDAVIHDDADDQHVDMGKGFDQTNLLLNISLEGWFAGVQQVFLSTSIVVLVVVVIQEVLNLHEFNHLGNGIAGMVFNDR